MVASAAAAVALCLSAQELSPEAVAGLAATLEEFTKHFVIGGFAAAVGYGWQLGVRGVLRAWCWLLVVARTLFARGASSLDAP